ncbi:hypothetical protein GGTG_10540, partial [Gaeumannomyces tritici R3-111a-1]
MADKYDGVKTLKGKDKTRLNDILFMTAEGRKHLEEARNAVNSDVDKGDIGTKRAGDVGGQVTTKADNGEGSSKTAQVSGPRSWKAINVNDQNESETFKTTGVDKGKGRKEANGLSTFVTPMAAKSRWKTDTLQTINTPKQTADIWQITDARRVTDDFQLAASGALRTADVSRTTDTLRPWTGGALWAADELPTTRYAQQAADARRTTDVAQAADGFRWQMGVTPQVTDGQQADNVLQTKGVPPVTSAARTIDIPQAANGFQRPTLPTTGFQQEDVFQAGGALPITKAARTTDTPQAAQTIGNRQVLPPNGGSDVSGSAQRTTRRTQEGIAYFWDRSSHKRRRQLLDNLWNVNNEMLGTFIDNPIANEGIRSRMNNWATEFWEVATTDCETIEGLSTSLKQLINAIGADSTKLPGNLALREVMMDIDKKEGYVSERTLCLYKIVVMDVIKIYITVRSGLAPGAEFAGDSLCWKDIVGVDFNQCMMTKFFIS